MTGNSHPAPEIPFQERYDLQEKLGEGGFGVVHKAFDYKLRRDVAIKLLKSDESSDKETKRFLREAEALARLKHPHIVDIYDFGDYDGQVYIVMDCLEGENLSEVVGSGKETTIDQYVRWLLTIAQALVVVHEEGLVHRDLKSHNIIIDWDKNAHLLDFGLVFLTDARSRLTKTEGSLGTPAYMSPEQARGKVVDPRADIYGWGATLFECLTGRVPFEGVTALNVLNKVIHDDPQEPSYWNRRVPVDLDVICLKCLEKDPKDRYQSAADLVVDVQRFLSGEAILARPRTWAEKTWRQIQRRKIVASLSFALILTIVTGAAGLILQWTQNYEKEQAYFDDIASKNRQLETAAEIDKQRLLEIKEQKRLLVIERDNVIEKQKGVARNKKLAKNSSASFIMKFSRYLAVVGESPKSIGFREELEKSLTGTAQYIANVEERTRYESALTYHRWRGHSVAQTPLITLNAENSKDGVWLKDNLHAVVIHSRNRVTLYHVPSNQVVREFKGKQRQITSVAVNDDESRVIVGDAYGFVQIWDLKSGESLRRFQAHKRILRQLDISPDGQRLITASDDPSVSLWDLKKKTKLHTFQAKNKVLCVRFSTDGKKAFAGGLGRSFRVLDVLRFKELKQILVPEMIRAIAVHPKGGEVAFSSYDGQIHFWDIEKKTISRRFYSKFTTLSLDYNASGSRLYAGRSSSIIQVWRTKDGRPLRPLAHSENATKFIAISPNDEYLLVGCRSGNARLLPTASNQELRPVQMEDGVKISQVSFTPNGSWLIGHSKNQCYLWDAETGLLGRQWQGHKDEINLHKVLSNGDQLLIGTVSGELALWDLVAEKELFKMKAHNGPITAMELASDNQRFATGGADGSIRIWDWGKLDQGHLQELKAHRSKVTGFVFYPKQPYLYSSSWDQYVRQWNLKTGKSETWLIRSPVSGLTAVTKWGQPDTLKDIVACGYNGAVMWIHPSPGSMGSGRGNSRLSRARLVHYNAATGTLFGAGLDGTLSLWLREGLSRRSNLSEFSEAPGVLTSLTVAQDGLRAATVNGGRVQIWDFRRARQYLDFEWVTEAMADKLKENPRDLEALATLRDWYYFRACHKWASIFQQRLVQAKGSADSLTAARLYWLGGDFLRATKSFERCLDLKKSSNPDKTLNEVSEVTLQRTLNIVRRKVKNSQ